MSESVQGKKNIPEEGKKYPIVSEEKKINKNLPIGIVNCVASCPSDNNYFYSVFHVIMSMIAIYLSFRCNKGFDMSSFISAILFPYIYIIYILSTRGTCGIIPGEK